MSLADPLMVDLIRWGLWVALGLLAGVLVLLVVARWEARRRGRHMRQAVQAWRRAFTSKGVLPDRPELPLPTLMRLWLTLWSERTRPEERRALAASARRYGLLACARDTLGEVAPAPATLLLSLELLAHVHDPADAKRLRRVAERPAPYPALLAARALLRLDARRHRALARRVAERHGARFPEAGERLQAEAAARHRPRPTPLRAQRPEPDPSLRLRTQRPSE